MTGSSDQSLVVVVIADPEPIERVFLTQSQGSIGIGDSCAPEIANWFKVERRVGRILLKEDELLVSGLLDGIKKFTIEFREIARGLRFQRLHSLPCVLPSEIGRNAPERTWLLTFSTK